MEDKPQPAPGPAPDGVICAQQDCVPQQPPSLVSSLSLLGQGPLPPLNLCLLLLREEGYPGPALGNLLAPNRQEGEDGVGGSRAYTDLLCSPSACLLKPRTNATGRGGKLPGCAQRASSSCLGEGGDLLMLVWTGAVLTQFGKTVKKDCQVENARRKIPALPGHHESLALGCTGLPPSWPCAVRQSSRAECLGPG